MLFEYNHWQTSAEEQETEDDDEVDVGSQGISSHPIPSPLSAVLGT